MTTLWWVVARKEGVFGAGGEFDGYMPNRYFGLLAVFSGIFSSIFV